MRVINLTLKEALEMSLSGKHNSDLYVIRSDSRSIKPLGEHDIDYLKINEKNRYVAIVQFEEPKV